MPRNRVPKGVEEALSTAANPPQTKNITLKDEVERMSKEIERALPSTIFPEPGRFIRMTLSALSQNPALQECTRKSFLGAMMMAAQLGLEVNTPLGHAYLIPYKNKGVTECQFQLGYKGLINLCYRSGQISTISAQVVYEKDEFEYRLGLHPDLIHIPSKEQDRGKPTHFYAIFRTKDGVENFDVMTVDEVKKHADLHSTSYGKGFSPWTKNFNSMALKTVLKRALKYAPLSAEIQRFVETDESIKHLPERNSDNQNVYVDAVDLPNDIDYGAADDVVEVEAEDVSIDEFDGQQTLL